MNKVEDLEGTSFRLGEWREADLAAQSAAKEPECRIYAEWMRELWSLPRVAISMQRATKRMHE